MLTHTGEKWVWPWARDAPKNFGFPFNISATAEANWFNFGMLGLAKVHHKTAPKFGVPFNYYPVINFATLNIYTIYLHLHIKYYMDKYYKIKFEHAGLLLSGRQTDISLQFIVIAYGTDLQ